MYGVGIVELELESTSAFILLLFVVPLAFTMSGFLMWIMHSLNGETRSFEPQRLLAQFLVATLAQLHARKQRYKLKMFQRLYYILLGTIIAVLSFFVLSSLTFSGRMEEGISSIQYSYQLSNRP